MKYILILPLLFFTSFHPLQTKVVYVCGSTGAKKYHLKETCRGLSSCSHEITKIPLSKAQSYGLTLCGWED